MSQVINQDELACSLNKHGGTLGRGMLIHVLRIFLSHSLIFVEAILRLVGRIGPCGLVHIGFLAGQIIGVADISFLSHGLPQNSGLPRMTGIRILMFLLPKKESRSVPISIPLFCRLLADL
jgi:hypothetical protein